MAKSYDEKGADFQRMLAGRLPKAVKGIELLTHLARKADYAYTSAEVKAMLDQIDDAVDGVAQAFGADTGPAVEVAPIPIARAQEITADWRDKHPEVAAAYGKPPVPIPGRDRNDIRSVLRMLQAGQNKEATAKLQNIVCGWVVPDKED